MKGCIKWFLILGGFVFVIFIIVVAASGGETTANRTRTSSNAVSTPTPDPAKVKANAVAIDYKDLHRNIESHIAKTIHYEGQILQSSEATVLFDDNYTVFRVMLDSGDVIWSEYHGDERFLEDDTVAIWATVNGLHTYETILGASVELPSATILLIELISQ